MDEIRVPTMEEIELLEARARELELTGAAQHFPEAIVVAAFTGVRLGELLALEWIDWDFSDELQVTKQRRRDGGTSPTKNGHSRTTLVLQPASTALEALHQAAEPWETGDRERLFNYSRREHTRVWGHCRLLAGLERIRWHDLRHFYATHLIDMGASDLDVSIVLGHRDGGELVRQTYGHPSPAKARDRLRRRLAGERPTLNETLEDATTPRPLA